MLPSPCTSQMPLQFLNLDSFYHWHLAFKSYHLNHNVNNCPSWKKHINIIINPIYINNINTFRHLLASDFHPSDWPILTKSSSINPREVIAGVPTRRPLGFIALLGWKRGGKHQIFGWKRPEFYWVVPQAQQQSSPGSLYIYNMYIHKCIYTIYINIYIFLFFCF